ncbi:SMI1/KNR4 family protein [Pseudomonas sp. SH1-B]
MESQDIQEKIHGIEKLFNMTLPVKYKQFLSEEVMGEDNYQIFSGAGECIYIYSHLDIVERNQTYAIQDYEPEFLMIGQDGDIGFFVNFGAGEEKIYRCDLGALGSLPMQEEATDIYSL